MKKTLTIIILTTASIAAHAQNRYNPFADKEALSEIFRSVVILLLIYILSTFVLTLVKLILNHRLKKTIVEKGAPEQVISQLLDQPENNKKGAIKWFILLTAVAIGLTIISFSLPMGVHSVIIMILSIALGFLGYYFLLKRLDK
jgi:hypothetical protein